MGGQTRKAVLYNALSLIQDVFWPRTSPKFYSHMAQEVEKLIWKPLKSKVKIAAAPQCWGDRVRIAVLLGGGDQ